MVIKIETFDNTICLKEAAEWQSLEIMFLEQQKLTFWKCMCLKGKNRLKKTLTLLQEIVRKKGL